MVGIFLVVIVASCATKPKIEYDYWRFENGDSTVRLSMETVNETVHGYCMKYYKNGQLLSKVRYENDKPMDIICVYDSLGNPLNYGHLKNGNGCVISYSDKYGTPQYSGCYVDGEREGWWKSYTFKGEFVDSFFCVKGDCKETTSLFRYVLY